MAGSQLSMCRLALSSMVAAGVQFGWALQLSLLTPYIQMLGIEHAFTSFIWLCGPITGLVVQPCVGIWSDKCKSRWGRRRPFIFVGVVLITLACFVTGFAADIGYLLGDSQEDCQVYKGVRPRAAGVFILGFWLLDLANNTVQGPARALLADLSGPDQRDAANAVFCLWMAVGNVLGFATGSYGGWHEWVRTLGSRACCEACANLKAAFLLSILFLVLCTAVTLFVARETPLVVKREHENLFGAGSLESLVSGDRMDAYNVFPVEATTTPVVSIGIPNKNGKETGHTSHEAEAGDQPVLQGSSSRSGHGSGASLVTKLFTGVRQLSPPMQSVLWVMSLSWLAWFPFFMFDTDWMGRELYKGNPKGDLVEAALYQRGVQEGAFGLLLNSIVQGISSLFIPLLCRILGSKHVWALGNYTLFAAMACTGIISSLTAAHEQKQDGADPFQLPSSSLRLAALFLFSALGFPLAITFSLPYSFTANLTADSDSGQGLAVGILNLTVVIPQALVALGAGPWDALFGGGNEPAFAFASISALMAGILASCNLPTLSGHRKRVFYSK